MNFAFNCDWLDVTALDFSSSEDPVDSDHRSARAQLYREALDRLQAAIEMLDRANAPGHIAAHVDLAMHQLQELIDRDSSEGRADRSQSKAAPE